ncbi:LysR family transcriptional regulator [Corynebacterium sp. L4756]|uniref:LysR family transcriptional regulator n=1 Tax=unclassified Corynebacterium TaxID=2624378 RepID=UPI00374CDA37
MNLVDVEGFLGVVRAVDAGESLSDAADDLALSQSALTRRVQRLEKELGTTLFERRGRTLVLNTRGQAFLPHARAMIDAQAAGIEQVSRLMDPERGRVRLDFMHSLGTWMVPDLLKSYRQLHPHVQFGLHQGAAQLLVDRIQQGLSDIALVGPKPQELNDDVDLEWHQLKLQRLAIGVSEGHWASGKESIAISELAAEAFIGMLPGYGTRMLLDALAAEAGFVPRLVFESMELTTVTGLVEAGLGCALLPLDDPYLNATNLIPLEPVRYRELGAVWRSGDDAPPVAQFRAFIRSR